MNGGITMIRKLKSIFIKSAITLLCVAMLTSCGKNTGQNLSNDSGATASPSLSAGKESASNTNTSVDSGTNTNAGPVTAEMVDYDKNDYYTDWKNQNPTYIELNGNTVAIKGSGAKTDSSKITISSKGTYVISGKLDNGQIIVDVPDNDEIWLVLNGMEINCSDSSPIYVLSADKVIFMLQEGTTNTVTDGATYTFPDAGTDEPNAAIFSKEDMTITGTGTLIVNGNYNNGIISKDDLIITGGIINVTAKDDGLMGKDKVQISEGKITINAGGDGIKSTNDTDEGRGFVAIEGGKFDITAGTDGIQAATSILITGGDFKITTGGGSVNSSTKTDNDQWGRWGPFATSTANRTDSQSAKAIKASLDITIKGGTFVIDSSDDAIHSNNSINISGGDFSITSGDDGIHADSTINIAAGNINISKSYEGIESAVVTISGGNIHVVASDDGINIAGGNDGSSVNGRRGQNAFENNPNNKLYINGGYIVIDAAGDGLDSNGSIYMTDGIVLVNGPTNSGNGALDYGGTFDISGGLLIAAGSSGMAQSTSATSKQYSIAMNFSTVQKAGTLISLADSEGNTVVTFAPKKQYQTVVISSPELINNGSYTLYTGGTATGNALDGLYTDGEYKDGKKVIDFTITSVTTWLNESGVMTGGGANQGGFGNPGFGRQRGVKGEVQPQMQGMMADGQVPNMQPGMASDGETPGI